MRPARGLRSKGQRGTTAARSRCRNQFREGRPSGPSRKPLRRLPGGVSAASPSLRVGGAGPRRLVAGDLQGCSRGAGEGGAWAGTGAGNGGEFPGADSAAAGPRRPAAASGDDLDGPPRRSGGGPPDRTAGRGGDLSHHRQPARRLLCGRATAVAARSRTRGAEADLEVRPGERVHQLPAYRTGCHGPGARRPVADAQLLHGRVVRGALLRLRSRAGAVPRGDGRAPRSGRSHAPRPPRPAACGPELR